METTSLFENVKLANVAAMLDVLISSGRRDMDFLRRRYLERATHFETTLGFLKESGLVDKDGNMLSPTQNEVPINVETLPQLLIPPLIKKRSRFRDEVLEYLRQFQIVDSRPIHRPTTEQRRAESEIRNFFMEMGVVVYDTAAACYILEQDHYSLMLMAHRVAAPVSPTVLRKNQKKNEDLGFSAELQIIDFERDRVGKRFAHHIKHIAALDAAAGYDIESVTLTADGYVVPRFIEVKAVSLENYRFFWTSNELELAQTFRTWYYLYLLPTNGRGTFNLEQLRIINDPATEVLDQSDQWNVGENVIECWLKKK